MGFIKLRLACKANTHTRGIAQIKRELTEEWINKIHEPHPPDSLRFSNIFAPLSPSTRSC